MASESPPTAHSPAAKGDDEASLLAATSHAAEVTGLMQSLERAEEELGLVKRQLEDKQGAAIEVEVLKKALAEAKEEAAKEQATREKHDARLDEEGGTLYQRGATRIPSVPATREQRWLIFPDGERGWDHHHSVRRPNSVLGVLCRQNFPGFVTLPGEGRLPELGLSWEHYVAAPAPPDVIIDGVVCDTRADMVIRTFWTFYRCEEGYEEDAAHVIENVCKCLLQNLQHEARVQAVRDYYALQLVMISGGGRSHGSIAIGDGLTRCPSTLPEIKARQSSSAPEIRPRERPVQLAIKAAIQSERDRTEKLLAEAAERQRELEERTTKMMEEERARNDMQARAMYELLVSVCEKTGQTAPPMPVIAPGTTVSFI
ncbi:uncharacterized protein [Aegilops tauschii subsp. strangulata]|uniref:uncharacterized protein n=1 Tax=Aegilops tauschii subsp. strangulata TaxID=200361 RepID=UPI003CC87030